MTWLDPVQMAIPFHWILKLVTLRRIKPRAVAGLSSGLRTLGFYEHAALCRYASSYGTSKHHVPTRRQTAMTSTFDQHLDRNTANFAALTPLSFLERTASVYPERLAIIHGDLRQTWAQTYARCRQLASSLRQAGIGKNDTVAVILPNTPPMVEAPLRRAHGRGGARTP